MSTVMIWITRVWLILHFNFDSCREEGSGWVEGGVQWIEIKVLYVENQKLTKVISFSKRTNTKLMRRKEEWGWVCIKNFFLKKPAKRHAVNVIVLYKFCKLCMADFHYKGVWSIQYVQSYLFLYLLLYLQKQSQLLN